MDRELNETLQRIANALEKIAKELHDANMNEVQKVANRVLS